MPATIDDIIAARDAAVNIIDQEITDALAKKNVAASEAVAGRFDMAIHQLMIRRVAIFAEAADEAMQYVVTYLHRLKGPPLKQLQEEMNCLLDFAKQQGWSKEQQRFIRSFLSDYGIGEPGRDIVS